MFAIFEWTDDERTSDELAAFRNGRIESPLCKDLATLQQWLNNRQVKGTRSVPFHPCCLCFLMHSKAWEGFSACLFWRSAHLGQCQCWSLKMCSAAMCYVIHCHWICSYRQFHPFMQQRFEFGCVMSAVKAELFRQTDLKSFMPAGMQCHCQITKAAIQKCTLIKIHRLPNNRQGQSNKSTCKNTPKQIITCLPCRQMGVFTFTHVSHRHRESWCLCGIPLCCVSVCSCSFSYPAV